MKTAWAWTQTAFAGIGGAVGWYLGGLDGFLYVLIAFVVVDYLTGVLRAIVEKQLSSRIGAKVTPHNTPPKAPRFTNG